MTEENDHFKGLVAECMEALEALGHLLRLHLPIPVELPSHRTSAWSLTATLDAVQNARGILGDMGLDDKDVALLNKAMLAWQGASDMTSTIRLHGFTEWRGETVEELLDQMYGHLQGFMVDNPCDGHSVTD